MAYIYMGHGAGARPERIALAHGYGPDGRARGGVLGETPIFTRWQREFDIQSWLQCLKLCNGFGEAW